MLAQRSLTVCVSFPKLSHRSVMLSPIDTASLGARSKYVEVTLGQFVNSGEVDVGYLYLSIRS
jgi:hypothetical protein